MAWSRPRSGWKPTAWPRQFGNGTIKLTTRQAFQFHGIIKSNLKRTIRQINQAAMDTIAACGDVNRNVMCNPNPYLSEVHAEVLKLAQRHLQPPHAADPRLSRNLAR